MRKVAIVTDGVCDLPQTVIDEYEISIVPYRIFFGDETYRVWNNDKSTITLEEFCAKLPTVTKETFPRTSMPSPGEIASAYKRALEKADSVIAVFLSAAMSGIIQSAMTVARTIFPDKDITVFDSKHTMSGTGLQALEAAKMAKAGKSKEEILERLTELNPRVRTIFAMHDLSFLYKGGRIGRARQLMGATFNIVPAVHFQNGIVDSLKAFRGEKGLITGLTAFASKILTHCETSAVAITHINHQKLAEKLYTTMQEVNNKGVEIFCYEASPIAAVYTGPKSICISYIGEFDKNWFSK